MWAFHVYKIDFNWLHVMPTLFVLRSGGEPFKCISACGHFMFLIDFLRLDGMPTLFVLRFMFVSACGHFMMLFISFFIKSKV